MKNVLRSLFILSSAMFLFTTLSYATDCEMDKFNAYIDFWSNPENNPAEVLDQCPNAAKKVASYKNDLATCKLVTSFCNKGPKPGSKQLIFESCIEFSVDDTDCKNFFTVTNTKNSGGLCDQANYSTGSIQSFVDSINSNFALKLLNNYSQNNAGKNFVVSPISIASAVSMAYLGASNASTVSSIESTLGFTNNRDENIKKLSWLFKSINKTHEVRDEETNKVQIKGIGVANGIWSTSADFKKGYVNDVDSCFSAKIEKKNSSIEVVKAVNSFVKDHTLQLIEKLLDSSTSPSDVLVNATSLTSDWKTQFNPDHTDKNGRFTKLDGTQKIATMMSGDIPCVVSEQKGLVRVVRLPFNRQQVLGSFIIIQPLDKSNPVTKSLDFNKLIKTVYTSKPLEPYTITMPKFTTTTEKPLLTKTLTQLGVKNFFGTPNAFSGITADKQFVFDEAITKTIIEVTEKGVKAAAATAISASRGMSPSYPNIDIDSPFAFMIVNDATHVIIFEGLVLDPSNQ